MIKFNSIDNLKSCVKEQQSELPQYLNIYTINYNTSLKTQQKQQKSSHDIQQFELFINKSALDDYLINNLMEVIQSWKSLKDMNIFLDSTQISKKQAIKFMLFTKRMFYPREFINYSFFAGYIQLKCKQSIIRFKYNITQNFRFKDLKLKFITFKFDREKEHYQNLIKNEIKRNSDLLCLMLYNADNLVVQCQNRKKHKQQIRLIFDNLDELLQFSIQEYKIVIVNLKLDCKFFERIQKTKIIQQIKKRYNFKCNTNSELTILSYENKNNQEQLSYLMKKIISRYFFNNQAINFFLLNKFKLQQFKEKLFPNFLSQCTQKQFVFHFFIQDENYFNNKYKIFKLSNKESKQGQKKRFNIYLNCINDSLNLFKHFFTTIQTEDYKYLSLKIYDIQDQQNQKKLTIYLENLDVNMDIKKLKAQICYKLPFITKLNSLQKICISGIRVNIEIFLQENKQLIDIQSNKMLKELILNIKMDCTYYETLKSYNTFKKISFHHITMLKLNNEERTEFKVDVMKFKRLVSLTIRNQQWDRKNKKFFNLKKSKQYIYNFNYNQESYYSQSKDELQLIAYQQTYHDNVVCGYSNMEYCTCNNFEMQKILQKINKQRIIKQ